LINELYNEGLLDKDDIARIGKKCDTNENAGTSKLIENMKKTSKKEIIK